jgi:hypothetical protein
MFDGVYWVVINNFSMDKHFGYYQNTPSKQWVINHPLKKYPSVCIFDEGGNEFKGSITYPNIDTVIINFAQQQTGFSYLN